MRSEELDAIFGALADASRRSMLAQLTAGESSVTELARPLDMSMPAVLKHLRVLEGAGLVIAVKDGRVKRCQLASEPLRTASDWLSQTYNFWNTQLNRLERYLDSKEPVTSGSEENTEWPKRPRLRSGSRSGGSTGSRRQKSSGRGRTRKS